MILNDSHIFQLCNSGVIEPYREDCINPASYDLTLAPDIIEIYVGGVVTADNHPGKLYRERRVHIQPGQEYLLEPGQFVLASSNEVISLPDDIAAQVSLKSTSARKGIGHIFAGWIDPGFKGQITFELFSHIPTVLVPGRRICQIVFYQMVAPAVKPYQGKYQNQVGATSARSEFPALDSLVNTGYIDAITSEPMGDIPTLSETEQKIKQLRSVKPSQGIDTARSGGFEWTEE